MRLSIARASAGGHTGGTDAAGTTPLDALRRRWRRMAWPSRPCSSSAASASCSDRRGRPAPTHRLRVRAGLRVRGQLRRQRLQPGRRATRSSRGSTTGTESPTRPAAPSTRQGNFYVDRRLQRRRSASTPLTARSTAMFATGLPNPLSLVFDNQGNLYVGQQTTPYIAEFIQDGPVSSRTSGPFDDRAHGDDWIDLAPDECTFYYTTEGTDILRYNKCTNTQLPNFNLASFPSRPVDGLPVRPSSSRSCPTATSSWPTPNADILLDPNGNVIQTYTVPRCRAARARSSPSASTPTASRSGPATRPRATSGRSTSPRATSCRRSTRNRSALSASRWTVRSRWPPRRPRSPRCRRRSPSSRSRATSRHPRPSRPC